jgi:two-component system LytT family sensor kinase
MNKQRLYWVFQIVGWTTYTILNILGVKFQSANFTLIMALPIVIESLYFFLVTHVYRNLSKRREWLQLPTVRLIPRVILAILAMAVSVYLIRIFTSFLLNIYTSEMWSLNNLIGNVIANIIILILWSSVYFAFHYFEKNTQSLKYEVAMNEMKLNQLKAQLNPHFIFNALNSIRALVDEEPKKSKRAINHLSNILRTSLVLDKKRLTSLKEEIDTTKDYLALESIRFEERLQIEFKVDPGTERIKVPPMMIQTLVENGIKHGISKLKEGGKVTVKTRLHKASMILEIRNTGQYNKNKINGTGQGLRNTRQRLDLIFGESANLRIYNETDNVVLTSIKIPINE